MRCRLHPSVMGADCAARAASLRNGHAPSTRWTRSAAAVRGYRSVRGCQSALGPAPVDALGVASTAAQRSTTYRCRQGPDKAASLQALTSRHMPSPIVPQQRPGRLGARGKANPWQRTDPQPTVCTLRQRVDATSACRDASGRTRRSASTRADHRAWRSARRTLHRLISSRPHRAASALRRRSQLG